VLDKLRAQLVRLDQRAVDVAQARQTLRQAITAAAHAEGPRP
jgi:hypothetical protein